jgi:hypothetical protein
VDADSGKVVHWGAGSVCQISNIKLKKLKKFELICKKAMTANKQTNKQTEPIRIIVSQTLCVGSQKGKGKEKCQGKQRNKERVTVPRREAIST